MGAGKTVVGRQLAKRLRRRFVDSDHEIEARTGVRIPTIFEFEGEGGFRKREALVLGELCREKDLVLATGGGAVLAPENRQAMRDTGVIVYLCASPEILYERTRHDRNRPLLQVENPLAKLTELYAQRDPIYRSIADLVVEGRHGAATTLAQHLETELRTRCEL